MCWWGSMLVWDLCSLGEHASTNHGTFSFQVVGAACPGLVWRACLFHMFSGNPLTILLCNLVEFASYGLLRTPWWDFFNLVLRLKLVMGISLGHRWDVFDRNINWPYVDWNLLSKFPFRHVLVFLCITFFRRHSLFMDRLCFVEKTVASHHTLARYELEKVVAYQAHAH